MKKKSFLNLKKIGAVAIWLVIFSMGCSKDPGMEKITASNGPQLTISQSVDIYPSVANELIVKFKALATSNQRKGAITRVNGQVLEHFRTKAMEHAGDMEGITLIRTPLEVKDAINKIKGLEIEYAEPNYIYSHNETSNDNYFTIGSLWGMYGANTSPANQYGSGASKAWALGNTGSNMVYVGVIDEGAQWSHEDLFGNIWVNQKEIDGDKIDNDGNGYIDDIHGWDFDKNDNSTYDGTQDDHGTHVSGTIGAIGGNGKGVAGICWNIKIINAKFLGTKGGTTANAIKAIDYITNLKISQLLNIVATNNSWGGGGYSQSLQYAIERANNQNILFCAAAGNGGADGRSDNNDRIANYPSNYSNSNVISVAAITSSGGLASFSNYGANSVDIGAPGVGIYSTLPNTAGNKYGAYSGTSMATPHVAGACALYASIHPGSNAAVIKSALLNYALPTASLAGKCVSNGRLNVSQF